MHKTFSLFSTFAAVTYGISVAIKIPFSGKCLDVFGGFTNDGNTIIQWDCKADGNTNQLFDFLPNANLPGYYQIRAVNSGKCIGVDPNVNTNGANIVQGPCTDTQSDRQNFKPTLNGDGTVTITSSYRGLCIDIWGVQSASGTNAIAWPCNGQQNQKFQTVGFATSCSAVSCPSGTKSYPIADGTCSPCYLPMWGYGCLAGKTCAPGLTCQYDVQGTSSTALGTCIQYVNAPCSNTPVLNEPFSLGTCASGNAYWGYSTQYVNVFFGGQGTMSCVDGLCKAAKATLLFQGFDAQVDSSMCISKSVYYRDGNGKGVAYCN